MAEEKEIEMVAKEAAPEVKIPALPDGEVLSEKDTKTRELMFKRMAGFDAKTNERMAAVREAGEQVWTMSKEDRAKIIAPAIIYTNKEGEKKAFRPRLENIAPLLQTQKEKGQKNPRYISAKEAMENKDYTVKKGAKAVPIVLYSKRLHARYTALYFNLSDVAGPGKDAAMKVQLDQRANSFARDTIEYLGWREKEGTFTVSRDGRPLEFTAVNYAATQSAAKQADERKAWAESQQAAFAASPEKQAAQERLNAIIAAGKSEAKPVGPEDIFRKYLAEAYAEDPKHYVTMAAKKAMENNKWDLNNVKNAITKLTPGAVYDATSGKAPYAERIVKYLEAEKAQDKSAAR